MARRTSRTNKPLLIIISGPTGAGKTAVLERLLKLNRRLATVASVTTRPKGKRKGGDHGYYFVTAKKFDAWRDGGKFLETARVHGYWYGTLQDHLDAVIKRHKIPVRVIDVKGYQKVKRTQHYRVCSLFITAESLAELRRRVLYREPTIDRKKLAVRLATARNELKKKGLYDAVFINRRGMLNQTVAQIQRWIDKCIVAG